MDQPERENRDKRFRENERWDATCLRAPCRVFMCRTVVRAVKAGCSFRKGIKPQKVLMMMRTIFIWGHSELSHLILSLTRPLRRNFSPVGG